MSALQNLTALKERVKNVKAAALKAAADSGAPSDPTDAGTVSIPKQDDAENPSKLGTPSGSNTNKNPADDTNRQTIGLDMTKPGPTGTDVPTTIDGTAADAAATKAASHSAKLMERAKAARLALSGGTKAASTAAPAPAASAAPAAAAAPTGEVATAEMLKQATEIYRQVGEIVCGTEEGRALAETLIAKQAGVKRAHDLMNESLAAAQTYEHIGALYAAEEQRAAEQQLQIKQAYEKMTPAQKSLTVKLASITERIQFQSKEEFNQFIKGAAAMEQALAGAGGGAPPPGGGDPAAGGAPPDLGAAQMPGGDGNLNPEDMMAILQQLVEQGIITEDQLPQVIAELTGQDPSGGAPGGGDPSAGGDPAGGSPEEAEATKAAGELWELIGAAPDLEAVAASFAAA